MHLQAGDWPPLVWAASENHMAILKLFLEKGANINSTTDVSYSALIRPDDLEYSVDQLFKKFAQEYLKQYLFFRSL